MPKSLAISNPTHYQFQIAEQIIVILDAIPTLLPADI